MKKINKQREETIHAQRIEKQREDFKKKEDQERRRIERLEKETLDMTFYGLWQNELQMNDALSKIKSKTNKKKL
ncbi:hypothetical protein DPMN_045903 [Dreissena polymorpha]|uniref:Uncharacterized protein n=1 Tax=Dreissena polymorpha TaxID=45954 RepID=A0A9D4I041_DREPO|nr:hypothetical protein DPMN_045903 [Dreissena polymorpha]